MKLADELAAALEAIDGWYSVTHGNEFGHDHHCPQSFPAPESRTACTCGWAAAEPALDGMSALLARYAAEIEG